MFSSVFDKVVSATAPDTLATFPPRADLPASASTLCCLSFADRFISHYPTTRATSTGDDIDGALLLERVGPSVGIAISTDDLESTMERAAELGGRLAAALAGTVRSKRREPATASVPDLLTKVRGIFGNRLSCVGREIRVSRNVQAERDETLLLRQIHALKNAALDACTGEKWCVVISSGGESVVVCSIPLPAVEEGASCGCDFLVFDPSSRPAMKLRGSYIVKFTTVRGLQLHVLSALGEIWREGSLSREGGTKKEFVGLSVVMGAKGREQLVGRRQLQDSVTSLRKAEKAAAIKAKREEVEALRRALERPSRQPKPTLTAPLSGAMFGLTDSPREAPQGDDVSDLSSGPPSFRCSTRSYRQQEPPRATVDCSGSLAGALKTCDGDIKQVKSKGDADPKSLAMPTTPPSSELPAPHVGLRDQWPQEGHRNFLDSRRSSGDRCQLRPPAADVSPPLSAGTPEREEEWRRWSKEDGETAGKMGKGEVVAVSASKRREDPPAPRGREDTSRVETAEEVPGRAGQDEAVISDTPLHRALLRSIEGEELAEYSKRAYSVYRTHGVIQDEAALDDYTASEPSAHDLSMSANQLCRLPPTSPPESPGSTLYGARSSEKLPADGVDQHGGARKERGPVGGGGSDAVMPFSPPPSSPHELRVTDFSEAEDVVSNKPAKPASSSSPPSKKFRSRLRAPRAGRASALATANARGKHGSRRQETSLGSSRDGSSKELLPPPPPSSETASAPPRRKEAWTKEGGGAEHDLPARTGGHTPELALSTAWVGSTLEVSDEDEDGIAAQSSSAFPRNALQRSQGSGGNRRSARQESTRTPETEGQESVDDGIETGGGGGNSEHSFVDEHVNKAETSKGWPIDRSAVMGGCDPTIPPAPSTSPRLKATTPQKAKDCLRRCDNTRSNVPRSGTTSASESPLAAVMSAPPPLNTRWQGSHRSRNGDADEASTEREALGERGKAPDNGDEEFVWFGQPDTPVECQPEQDFGNTRQVRDEEGAPAPAPAPTPAPAPGTARTVAAAEQQQFGPEKSSPRQQQRSKAQLLLEMEVRRQRAIIEQAFRAREEEHRLRRARIGAEVFKRIRDLRRRRGGPPSPPSAPTVPPTSGPEQPPAPTKQESSTNDDGDGDGDQGGKEPRSAMHREQEDAAVALPSYAEQAVKAWGFRPAPIENTAEAVHPERPVPDTTPSGGGVSVGTAVMPPAETLTPAPPPESAHRVAAAADNPWRRVVSTQRQPGLEGGPATKREPTPPPVRFDVEASAFLDGAERPDGGMNHDRDRDQDNARRQERYEALRARKMAEAEERREGQKQRKAAAREEQRRKMAAAAAAAAAAAVADEEQYGQDTKNEPQRQNVSQPDFVLADGPSFRTNGYIPRTSSAAARPRSSSLARHDDSYTRQGTSSLGDSNGSGGGRPRAPAPGAGSVASPAVRGFSRRSNRKLVRNAINFLCLAGGHLEKKKARVLEALDSHPASNFVVLLAHTKLRSFKGLYACSGDEDGTADRVFGLGPPQVDATMASGFYKYNSAAREFGEVHSKSLGKTTDAVSMEPTRLKRPKGLVTQ